MTPAELPPVTHCPLCACTDTASIGVKHVGTQRYVLARCQCCQLVLVVSPPSSEELERYYERLWSEDQDPARLRQTEVVRGIEALRFSRRLRELRRLTAAGRLLDVGCKDGAFLAAAREAGWQVEGVELARPAAERAQQRGLSVFVGTLADAPLAPASCHGITLWHILEHVVDPVQLLRTVHRLLQPGGIVAIETPNVEGRGFRRHGLDWEYLTPPAHLRYFGPRSLRRLLELTGYELCAQRFEGGTGLGPQLSRAGCGALRQWALKHYRWMWPLKRAYLACFGRLAPSDDLVIVYARKQR